MRLSGLITGDRKPLVEWRASHISDPVERLRYLRAATDHAPRPKRRLLVRLPRNWRAYTPLILLGLVFVPGPSTSGSVTVDRPLPLPQRDAHPWTAAVPNVWLVEKAALYETYSNGLRIETQYTAGHRPRKPFPGYSGNLDRPAVRWLSEPRGIVFHTTESLIVPFEPGRTREMLRLGRGLLDYVKSIHAYHFLIDRFGRVFRVVPESDVANHAGPSVWADPENAYVGLNESFLGVAVETQTGEEQTASSGQIHSLRILTEMLRAKYKIPMGNCVTHAQVSVNPGFMKIAYHTDWANRFPYLEVGLTDNYALAPASVAVFGFEYDQVFLQVMSGEPWKGLLRAREQVRQQAAAAGVSVVRYKSALEQRYRKLAAALAIPAATGEKAHANE
ncbi:MAG: peptidoglycan recognition protein family protein [Bryobacteraceae bacterium]|nr:peptidoglycan recognition protein family protein [Bryobacteraceae bacterium]